jgi:quinol monooxygenase YgiN
MYGTIAKLTVKPGQMDAFQSVMAAPRERPGSVAGYVYQMDEDPNVLYLVVMFESKEAYQANANNPETNADYEKMVKFLVREPEWHDGAVMKIA